MSQTNSVGENARSMEAADFSKLGEELKSAKQKNALLKKIIIGLLAVMAVIVYWFYYNHVGRYATLEDIKIIQDSANPRSINFSFKIAKDGFLRYGYENAVLEEQALKGEKQFSWQWGIRKTNSN